jgi:nicotinate-nucleotide pyrophosphorylase (carboxylating)
LISKENFVDLDFTRFQRLSTAIGRFFSACRRLIDTRSSEKDRREAIYYLVKIEVEVDTRAQLKETLVVEVDAVLLDNISIAHDLKRGVAMIGGHAINEASGRVTPETASAIAERASTPSPSGWLTHRAPILDIGLGAA